MSGGCWTCWAWSIGDGMGVVVGGNGCGRGREEVEEKGSEGWADFGWWKDCCHHMFDRPTVTHHIWWHCSAFLILIPLAAGIVPSPPTPWPKDLSAKLTRSSTELPCDNKSLIKSRLQISELQETWKSYPRTDQGSQWLTHVIAITVMA